MLITERNHKSKGNKHMIFGLKQDRSGEHRDGAQTKQSKTNSK